MKKLLTAAALTLSLAAYAHAESPMVGNDSDEHGCKASAGQSYSFLRKKMRASVQRGANQINRPKQRHARRLRHPIRQQSAGGTIRRGHRRKHYFA